MGHGIVATTIKGAFKVYLCPSMRARTTFAAMAEGWSDLVTEARQEVAARRQFQSATEREVGPAVAVERPAPQAGERPGRFDALARVPGDRNPGGVFRPRGGRHPR